MNTRFIHRIIKSSIASAVQSSNRGAIDHLANEMKNSKIVYFGEFHSEKRIVEFQAALVRCWKDSLSLGSSGSKKKPRLHVVMEHFSTDMDGMLQRYQQSKANHEAAFDELANSYMEAGTEGHDLVPYRDLLELCRETTTRAEVNGVQVLLHGGFIPRPQAVRLNKECPDIQSKAHFFREICNDRGYLPKQSDPMFGALFEDPSTYRLRGSPEHEMLIQSMMSGADLYSPVDGVVEISQGDELESPMARLYQAQLLKDHAMGYRIASLMLEHCQESKSMHLDRYLVIAGFGHLKHKLGVPECVTGYLRQEAISHSDDTRQEAAMDLLLRVTEQPVVTPSNCHPDKLSGRWSPLIGCQMLYEAYFEDHYPPLVAAIEKAGEDRFEIKRLKQTMIKGLYLKQLNVLDQYILESDEVNGPLLRYSEGVAAFGHPCADYLFLYDEDDDNVISDEDMAAADQVAPCPYSHTDAKVETREAYERVGKTAGLRGSPAKARAIMSQIGYSDDDMSYIGDDDLFNWQGVANPHSVAEVKSGENVIDLGSGLGVDSILAARDCGADKYRDDGAQGGELLSPCVVGVDLAASEVHHSNKRASERGYSPNRVRFLQGDVEKLDEAFGRAKLPFEGQFDVAISNGAFCLIPSKRRAFENIYKALKPGGRMAISQTTVRTDQLDPEHEWPVCIQMFAKLSSLLPMLESIGFQSLAIVDASSPLEGMELLVDEGDQSSSERFKIHGRYADQYKYLESIDMDELCQIITVYGKKPAI